MKLPRKFLINIRAPRAHACKLDLQLVSNRMRHTTCRHCIPLLFEHRQSSDGLSPEIASYRAGDRDRPVTVLIGASRVLAAALLFFTFVE